MTIGVGIKVGKKILPMIGKKLKRGGGLGLNLLGTTAGMGVAAIGGTAALLGGAMSLTGGVLNAGSTIAGIASDAAGSVIGAIGGLGGKGQSGNTQPSTELQTIGSAMNKKGPSGFPLANVKSMLPATVDDGAMSMLPTGEESETTLLSQILGQTRTNTSVLTAILGVLSANLTQSNLDSAKNLKGDPPDPPEPGIFKRTFSAVGDKLKSLSSSLSGTAKNILKGIGLVGLLVLFKKYRTQISGVVANIFETLQGWYSAFSDGGNPISDMFDNVKTYFNEQVLPTLKEMTINFLKMLFDTIRTVANSVLPKQFQIPDIFAESGSGSIPQKYDSTADQRLSGFAFSEGPENLGGVRPTTLPERLLGAEDFSFSGGAASDNMAIQQAVKDKLQMMYEYFQGSGGRIQWTGIGEGFELGGGIDSFYKSGGRVDIAGIMTSKPIVDGYDRTIDDLNNPNLLNTPFGEGDSTFKTAFIANLVKMSNLKQQSKYEKGPMHVTRDFKVFTPFGEKAGEVLNNLESETRAIVSAAAAYDAQSVVIGGNTTTTNNSKTDTHVQPSVLSTDLNLSTYHFGDAVRTQ